ncbi:MAG TPA: ATP-binding protein [Streptosporangiaceae bacterium]
MKNEEVARIVVRDSAGIFAARQLGREAAGELGLEGQDQARVAAAISELGRSAVVADQAVEIVFAAGEIDLEVEVTFDGPPTQDGITAAGRLMDAVSVHGPTVMMAKRRHQGVLDVPAVRARLAATFPVSALDELRRDNEDLIAALEDAKRQKDQLAALNAELEETNQGVMALYNELSEELKETNRGVVALYAELDDKSERLREASEAKNRFWANVSHELRSPLTSIIGLTKLLADAGDDALGTEQHYQVDLIRSSASSLLALVNDLLDVAKAESGQIQLDPAQVNLPALLGRIRGLTWPMAEGKQVEVVVSEDGAPATILTDEVALTSILRNLLSNAIKYTPAGEVRLSVRAAGNVLEFVVADTGVGIPANQQEHVFEEFYQVPGTGGGGTGLGLPYARRLAGLLGGDLTLTSEPEVGTTVRLRLPNGQPAAGTVVIADDDPAFRQVLRGCLAGMAAEIIEAADGEQALAAVAAGRARLVLADLDMPGMDGRALLAELPPDVPAIVITGLAPLSVPGAAAVLRKDDISADRLAFTIRTIGGGAE